MDAWNEASGLLLYGFVIAAVAMDFYHMRISNRLILVGLIISLICRIGQDGISVVIPYLGNIVFPVVCLYLFYLIGILGAGDIKLFSVIGGFVNFKKLVQCMMLSFAAGAVLALLKLMVSGSLRTRLCSGLQYMADLFRGKIQPYERMEGRNGNLMHFSLAIFLGLIWMEISTMVI